MAKTLVMPRCERANETLPNGHGNCYGRWANDGLCPGVKHAAWLNALGDDNEPYGTMGATNLDVRLNWLKTCDHIVAAEPKLTKLREEERTLSKRLAVVKNELEIWG